MKINVQLPLTWHDWDFSLIYFTMWFWNWPKSELREQNHLFQCCWRRAINIVNIFCSHCYREISQKAFFPCPLKQNAMVKVERVKPYCIVEIFPGSTSKHPSPLLVGSQHRACGWRPGYQVALPCRGHLQREYWVKHSGAKASKVEARRRGRFTKEHSMQMWQRMRGGW